MQKEKIISSVGWISYENLFFFRVNIFSVQSAVDTIYILEIKPCGLGSRIRDTYGGWMEAEIQNWSPWWIFGKQNWRSGMNRTLS